MPTIPGPDGTPFSIDPPQGDEGWSSDEEQKTFYRQLDLQMGAVYLRKMTALGYEVTVEGAIIVYHDQTLKKQVDDEYSELESSHRMNSITALLEEFERKIRPK